MIDKEISEKSSELSAEIAALPKGYISQKNIKGNVYYYHQWSEDGKKRSKYLRDEEVKPLAEQIEKRKMLQTELRDMRKKPTNLGRPTENKQRKKDVVSCSKCKLMHKRIPVADIELDESTGFIQKIGKIYASEHLPVGIQIHAGIADKAALNDWWTERSIPASRSGVREALETLEITSTKTLLARCYGLSLSDQYWICPEGVPLSWEKINFFQNDFSDDIGDVLFGGSKKVNALDFSSPDNTSDGNLKKRWKIIDGKRYLIKGGSNPYRQQPFNEVIADGIMRRLGIAHVPYSIIWNNGAPYSVCEDFIDENTELIPAWRIFNSQKKSNSMSIYQHFVKCCEKLGIQGIVPFLDRMITMDYIIANEDRHLNNFGALRNAETLEWIGMAPIYDSGSSLGYDKLPAQILRGEEILCKPFKKDHVEQLRLVSSFDWLDLGKLEDVKEFILESFSGEKTEDFIDERRVCAITESVGRRIEHLRQLIQMQNLTQEDNTENDVVEDIAERYV